MIEAQNFEEIQDLPEEIRKQLGKDWVFLGETPCLDASWKHAHCAACNQHREYLLTMARGLHSSPDISQIVSLRPYRFITSDLLVIGVYFGACDNCGRVYWAREAPPYHRARQVSQQPEDGEGT